MSLPLGVCLALSAAVSNTASDSLRKAASSIVPTEGLVSLVAIIDALVSNGVVLGLGGFADLHKRLEHPYAFYLVTVIGSLLLLGAKIMYQKALSLSPLSLTIPFLSFTPAILVLTAYVLLGELPSGPGLVGVVVVALGGYLLSLKNTASAAALSAKDSLEPCPAGNDTEMYDLEAVKAGQGQLAHAPFTIPVHNTPFGGPPQSHQYHMHSQLPVTELGCSSHAPASHSLSLSSSGQAPASYTTTSTSSSGQTHSGGYNLQSRGTSAMSLMDMDAPGMGTSGRSSNAVTTAAYSDREGREKERERDPMAAGGMPSSSGSSVSLLPHHHGGHRPRPGRHKRSHSIGAVSAWFSSSSLLLPWNGFSYLTNVLTSNLSSLSRLDRGTLMMMSVAAIFSVTASLDKLGILFGPNVWVYFALQRGVIAAICSVYLLLLRRDLLLFYTSPKCLALMTCISIAELLTVVLFLLAVQHIMVSYVVAIKRSNIIMSVVMGRVVFRESIASRLPYVALMLVGMSLIVLEPGASLVHHTHN